jgi:hypothetical protein
MVTPESFELTPTGIRVGLRGRGRYAGRSTLRHHKDSIRYACRCPMILGIIAVMILFYLVLVVGDKLGGE